VLGQISLERVRNGVRDLLFRDELVVHADWNWNGDWNWDGDGDGDGDGGWV
jgi:hypothetical protein